ncbi:hypothetical protein [Patulibacter defluvii]|uniref:hypothetical protein n=1 Tax=Patulibacter defluvii TaxID=3095358 RepID=UPI002A750BFB|nr:hypothetical protein [Patulibacter sp. DM4]
MAAEIDLPAAERFLLTDARLIDRLRFAHRFRGGDAGAVRRALAAYRNDDGGYAGVLEPDLRTPSSQPQSAELALRLLDELGPIDAADARPLCDWLTTVSDDEGGVPFTLASAREHPAAPHWHHGDADHGSLNPTAALASLLHRHGIEHPWRERATAFCWQRLADPAVPLEMYDVRAALWLLDPAVPPGPEAARERLVAGLHEHTALDPAALAPGQPHRLGPLQMAPLPTSPGRALLPPDAVAAQLDALAGEQREDGGWDVPFPTVSAGARAEWRGWATVEALTILDAAGRLDR